MEPSDFEVEKEVIRVKGDMIRKLQWYICRIGEKDVLLPDTTSTLGEDVYGIKKLQCGTVPPDLKVPVWPVKFVENLTAHEHFIDYIPYSQAIDNPDLVIDPGTVVDGKAKSIYDKRK